MLLPALGLALALWVLSAQAAPRVEADPNGNYPIRPEVGAWLICAASFSGDEAPDLARQLVFQIRSQCNLPAYVFNRADEERQKQKALLDAAQAANPIIPTRRRTVRVEEQCAILVGGYPDIDTARRMLDEIKKLPLPNLQLRTGQSPFDVVGKQGEDGKVRGTYVNPFSTAFVSRNPSLPPQQANRYDPGLEKFNACEDFSLLKCPRPWTLVVKQYAGYNKLEQAGVTPSTGFMSKLWGGANKPGDALDAAGAQAHELARVLRQLNFQSFVLHTRTNSLVTVGAFSGPNDPDMRRVSQMLAALRERIGHPNPLDPLQLISTPIPMEIPKPPGQKGPG